MLVRPSARRKMMRARKAKAWAELGRFDHYFNCCRWLEVSSGSGNRGFAMAELLSW